MLRRVCIALAGLLTASGCSEKAATDEAGFDVLADAADSHPEAEGTATVRSFANGTDVELSLRGLRPSTAYTAHVHDAPCDSSPVGGGHWQNDPDGGTGPDNEIHMPFNSYADGTAKVSAHSRHGEDEDMRAIVVHVDDVLDEYGMESDRVLCADLRPAG
ncbi:hypothetical protein [Salininema proteolyticum]|uniref:Superoxide dismutase, Cu-Zn family n=1 Tax=Salininema proteolyticum TaxID=1607685 RepID=A0ABV8U0X8_9ACTN